MAHFLKKNTYKITTISIPKMLANTNNIPLKVAKQLFTFQKCKQPPPAIQKLLAIQPLSIFQKYVRKQPPTGIPKMLENNRPQHSCQKFNQT